MPQGQPAGDIPEFLRSVSIFRHLPPPVFRHLSEAAEARKYSAGTTILHRGEPGRAMLVLVSGDVDIPILDGAGHQKFVARLGAGEWFGEMALLTGEKRAADVIARTDVEAIAIRKDVLEEVMRRSPSVARVLTSILGARLLESDLLRKVGKYKLIEEIGRGGQAIVYTGIHPLLNRQVAVKMLSHDLVYDEDFEARFRQEAQIIAGLDHENIIAVYDTESAYATYFIIMELITGTTLAKIIDTQGRLPFDQTREILIQLCSALGYAHAHGIIHRDIKPANVMINNAGRVKLMDFGIARVQTPAVDAPTESDEEILGTAEYMSPEQITGDQHDGRADIYSLGVMAYEMCTASVPFAHEDPYEILRAHLRAPIVPPRDLVPELPDDLNDFVHRCLKKRKEERFQNLEEAVSVIERPTVASAAPAERGVRVLTLLYDKDEEFRVDAIVDDVRRQIQSAAKRIKLAVSDPDAS